jgi:hypothetical protein
MRADCGLVIHCGTRFPMMIILLALIRTTAPVGMRRRPPGGEAAGIIRNTVENVSTAGNPEAPAWRWRDTYRHAAPGDTRRCGCAPQQIPKVRVAPLLPAGPESSTIRRQDTPSRPDPIRTRSRARSKHRPYGMSGRQMKHGQRRRHPQSRKCGREEAKGQKTKTTVSGNLSECRPDRACALFSRHLHPHNSSKRGICWTIFADGAVRTSTGESPFARPPADGGTKDQSVFAEKNENRGNIGMNHAAVMGR